MRVLSNNLNLLHEQKDNVVMSLYCGSFCLPPYIGFKLGKTIHMVAQLDPDEVANVSNIPGKFNALVMRLLTTTQPRSTPRQSEEENTDDQST